MVRVIHLGKALQVGLPGGGGKHDLDRTIGVLVGQHAVLRRDPCGVDCRRRGRITVLNAGIQSDVLDAAAGQVQRDWPFIRAGHRHADSR